MNYKEDYNFVKQVFEEDLLIARNPNIIIWGWNLYYYLSLWVNKNNPDIMLDPILEDLVVFVDNIKLDPQDNHDKIVIQELLKMAVNLVTHTSIIKRSVNTYTRKKLLTNIIDKYVEYVNFDQKTLMKIMMGIIEVTIEFDKMDAHVMYRLFNKMELYFQIDHYMFFATGQYPIDNFIKALNLILKRNPNWPNDL